MAKTVLQVKNLTKVFLGGFSWKKLKRDQPTVAVENLSFQVKEGEIVGLLGPNGAGKTTTIQMLLGTTTKTRGEIKYFGKDFYQHRSEIMEEVNYASAYTELPWRMTVYENLMVYAKIFAVEQAKKRVESLLAEFKMKEYVNKQMVSLSAGQKTRVIMAKAFLNYPKILLLDEPTASLDPDIAEVVRRFLLKQQKKYRVAMLFTSHNMAEVSQMCDRVVFLKKGKKLAEGTPDELAKTIKNCRLRLKVGDGLKRLRAFSEGRGYLLEVAGREVAIEIKEEEVASFLNKLARHNISYSQISIDKPNLKDYFVSQSKEKEE